MKLIVILTFCVSVNLAAPAVDEDVREFENHNTGDFNEVEEHISPKSHAESELSTFPTIQDLKLINKVCMQETNTDKKLIEMVLVHHIIPTDPKYRKFLACSYRKQKYLNDSGEIQFHNIMRFLSQFYKKEDLKVLDVCGELKQTENAGDNAYYALKCILPKLLPLQEIVDE